MTVVHNQWYVQYGDQSYGPFSHDQMVEFVEEGRIIDRSMVSADPTQGFFEASRYPTFNIWKEAAAQLSPQLAAVANTETASLAQEQYTHSDIKPVEAYAAGHDSSQLYAQDANVQSNVSYVQPSYASEQITKTAEPYQAPKSRVLIIMAEIRSGQDMRFLQVLQSQGMAQRVGDTVWLLRTTLSAEKLRDMMAQFLGKQDRLFIVDSFNNETSWVNIGADMGPRIKEMWGA